MSSGGAVQEQSFHAPETARLHPLAISPEGQRRFVVGLSWGARDHKDIDIHVPHLKDENGHYDVFYFFKLPYHVFRIFVLSIIKFLAPGLYKRGVADWKSGVADPGRYDLDLSCYIFDEDMNLVCLVGPSAEHYSDPLGRVYHSGDDIHGSAGTGDNEQAFVETRDLPSYYAHFFFVVETDGRYSLADTPHAKLRLADSLTNRNTLVRAIDTEQAATAHGYIFAHVLRDGNDWQYRDVDLYQPKDCDWIAALKSAGAGTVLVQERTRKGVKK